MQFVAAASAAHDLSLAREQVHLSLLSQLQAAPDVLFVFVPASHCAELASLAAWLREVFPAASVLGGSVPGLLATQPADSTARLSVLAGVLPNVRRIALRIADMRTTRKLPDLSQLPGDADMSWVLLSDPRSVDTEALLRALHARFRNALIIGSLAGDVAAPEHTALSLDGQTHAHGAVALGFSGNLDMHVSLLCGCRPIGEPLIVLAAEGNTITQFDQGPAGQVVRSLVEFLPEADRRRISSSLCLGMQPLVDSQVLGNQDFVMRSLLSVDSKGVAVVDTPRKLQVVQFHLRDDEYYRRKLRAAVSQTDSTAPPGALLFASAGLPVNAASELASPAALIGCRTHGEIAPLGGQPRLHGLTSVLAQFALRG